MVFAISPPTSSLSLHSSLCRVKSSATFTRKTAIFVRIGNVPHLGLAPFAQWNGLKHVGAAVYRYRVNRETKGETRGRGVYASLFGIGAPEVLVIGVVALLVFGPKGLAEVARNLGKTVRAFQPTIRELQDVSREFKSTLQREIGLDDVVTPIPRNPNPVAESQISNLPKENIEAGAASRDEYATTAPKEETEKSQSQSPDMASPRASDSPQDDSSSSSSSSPSIVETDEKNSKSDSPSKEAASAVTAVPSTKSLD